MLYANEYFDWLAARCIMGRCVFFDQAALGIAHLLIMAMAKEGVSATDAAKKIWMVDSRGLIVKVTEMPYYHS